MPGELNIITTTLASGREPGERQRDVVETPVSTDAIGAGLKAFLDRVKDMVSIQQDVLGDFPLFGKVGCSDPHCPFHQAPECTDFFCCALNLSDALLRAGYTPPAVTGATKCPHGRFRGAADLAKSVRAQNGGRIDASTWAGR